jgi:2-dehydro-3-deoxyphosphogluconate aldolase/(4S)-4-hydroxy-2-oxoglutarate aldolase
VNKYEVFEALKRHKIAAVLRGNGNEVKEAAERLVLGGVRILEITFTVPGADVLIRELKEKYSNFTFAEKFSNDKKTAKEFGADNDKIIIGAEKKTLKNGIITDAEKVSNGNERAKEFETNDRVIIGAGTVLDAETARAAILSGAEFIVSPAACVDVVRLCNRYSVAAIPGVATATELLSVLEYGADFVKLFPANTEVLRALKAPFPNVSFMVTGGVDADNLADFFKAGASAVGAGSNLTKKDADIKKWLSPL